jgi:hypothetical protein
MNSSRVRPCILIQIDCDEPNAIAVRFSTLSIEAVNTRLAERERLSLFILGSRAMRACPGGCSILYRRRFFSSLLFGLG